MYVLEQEIWKRISYPHQFLCLTDLDQSHFEKDFVELVKLKHGWPGWWSKMELFRPDIFDDGDTVLYLDLDTVVVRDIGHLEGAIDCDLILLRDFYRPMTNMATGMMGWTAGQFTDLYHFFERSRFKASDRFSSSMGGFRSDQEFIQKVIEPKRVRYWQDEFPDQVVSYKVHCERALPAQAHVVCFHGKPRPSEVEQPWARNRFQSV